MLKCGVFVLIYVVMVVGVLGRPVEFNSLEEFEAVSVVDKVGVSGSVVRADGAGNGVKVTGGHQTSEWVFKVVMLVVSVFCSGAFVCSCWCGIKCIRNGCSCKRAWFTPKSMDEYRRRKEAKEEAFEIKMGFGQQRE
ncbi:unnamed protein product [Adineta ricciae]|uniref:Transmembrane protein n=1 Tax=Adineta ricciae TaxID=249248 RepID=A0A814JXW4_ADIRI|nr:unnamed protein product [Adineta ricciae]CAF1463672.1 unnamed protein product [Adineta ricciae]